MLNLETNIYPALNIEEKKIIMYHNKFPLPKPSKKYRSRMFISIQINFTYTCNLHSVFQKTRIMENYEKNLVNSVVLFGANNLNWPTK